MQYRRRLGLSLGLLAGALPGCSLFEPSPEEILARIEVPPAPVLTPEEARLAFRTAPGFRVELVAAEPLVVDPVAMDWDEAGRLYVVEMRGYMPDLDATGEERPVGRVVLLTDDDGDGRMDTSRVFLDGLVLPRAIAVLPEGVLIGAPPDLILCQDRNGDDRCSGEERERLGSYATDPGNVEHLENRLLPGLDGWLYNAKSKRRLRLVEGRLEEEETLFRGQWGLAQDDDGRLYANHNSGFLYVDLFPGEYALRQPELATRLSRQGLDVDLAPGASVYGVRVAPGLNRAYEPGTLRADGRQNGPTGVSGLAIQRGPQYGPEYLGDAFVPESAGAAVARFSIELPAEAFALGSNAVPQATHVLFPDPDWGEREFLASSDERFRPVDARVGPDGTIWVIDMYRGVIQHAEYVSDHLRAYVLRQGLEAPGAYGRIWRIVREDRPIRYAPPPLATLEERLGGLDHPNGWVRDRAQRALVAAAAPETIDALRSLSQSTPKGRQHALYALAALDALDPATFRQALADVEPAVRRTALHVGRALVGRRSAELARPVLERLGDADASVRLQAIHTAGELSGVARPVERLVAIGRGGAPLEREAALSGLAGRELAILRAELDRGGGSDSDWIERLTAGAYLTATRGEQAGAEGVEALLDLAATLVRSDHARAADVLSGLRDAQLRPGSQRAVVTDEHPLFRFEPRGLLGRRIAAIRGEVTWPGDPSPGGARPLSADEQARRQRGAALFAETCATCHGADGRGSQGLAPPLVGSGWVRDSDEWLIRIVLQGLTGPIEVAGRTFEGSMPGHGHDPRFDDERLAGLLTHLRRSWGHADEPVSPQTVRRIREATRERRDAWSVEELLALPVEHRLDRFEGIYGIPIVNVEFAIERQGTSLMIGRRTGGRAPLVELADGIFAGEGLQIQFDPNVTGPPPSAEVVYGGRNVTISRVDD